MKRRQIFLTTFLLIGTGLVFLLMVCSAPKPTIRVLGNLSPQDVSEIQAVFDNKVSIKRLADLNWQSVKSISARLFHGSEIKIYELELIGADTVQATVGPKNDEHYKNASCKILLRKVSQQWSLLQPAANLGPNYDMGKMID